MNNQMHYVQFTTLSSDSRYNGLVVNMPLEDFGAVLSFMERERLRAHFKTAEHIKEENKSSSHPIQEF